MVAHRVCARANPYRAACVSLGISCVVGVVIALAGGSVQIATLVAFAACGGAIGAYRLSLRRRKPSAAPPADDHVAFETLVDASIARGELPCAVAVLQPTKTSLEPAEIALFGSVVLAIARAHGCTRLDDRRYAFFLPHSSAATARYVVARIRRALAALSSNPALDVDVGIASADRPVRGQLLVGRAMREMQSPRPAMRSGVRIAASAIVPAADVRLRARHDAK